MSHNSNDLRRNRRHRKCLLSLAVGAMVLSSASMALAANDNGPAAEPGTAAVQEGDSGQEAARTGAKTLDKVVVTADRDGLASQGYQSEIVSQLGPLGSRSVLETPFSLNIIPAELVQNRIASSADDLFRINPVVQLSNPQSRFYSGGILRGFPINQVNKVDGLSNTSFTGIDIEDKERIEVMTGLSGFLYGAGNVGGTINYVLKRPTAERLTKFILNNNSGENFSLQADLGGPIDSEGKVRYRLNALTQDGDLAIDFRSIKRTLVSAALDWKTGPLLWQFNASHADYEMRGSEPYWTVPPGMAFPKAPDTNKYYGQAYTFTKSKQQNAGARVDWAINSALSLRAALKHRTSEMDLLANNNTFVADRPGHYTTMGSQWEYPDNTDDNGYLFLDAAFGTGALEHRLTAGAFVDRNKQTNFRTGGWEPSLGNDFGLPEYLSLDAPFHGYPVPRSPTGAKLIVQRSQTTNYLVGDEITLGNWTALLGLTHTKIRVDSYDGDVGGLVRSYDEAKTTPAVTVLYRASENLSVYGNFMKSLEMGDSAGAEHNGYPLVNAGQVMPPLLSDQMELGLKYKVGGMLLTTALFDIDRGLEYVDDTDPTRPVFVQNGRQRHRGVEFTASGRLGSSLTLVGGFTLLDPEISKSEPQLEGKEPMNVAKTSAKLYAEYDVASIPGLTLTGGAFHTGEQYADQLNTTKLDAFTTIDIGGRIVIPLKEQQNLTLRMNVSNLTGKDYWLLSRSLGPPRTIMFSVQVDL